MRNGTGRARSQPATRIGLRPIRSDRRAATRLMTALVTPKLTMNEVMAVFEVSPNSCSPRSGSTVRSSPTIAPTKALRRTRSENCGRFSRRPSRTSLTLGRDCGVGSPRRPPAAVADLPARSARTRPWMRTAKRRVEAALEADRGAGLAAQPLAAGGAAEVGREDLDVVRKLEELAVEALVELLRERCFRALSEQIGPAHAAREERIAGEHEPGLWPSGLVGDQERDAVRRVAWRVQDGDPHVTKVVLLPILEVHVGELDRGRLVDENRARRSRARGAAPRRRDPPGRGSRRCA